MNAADNVSSLILADLTAIVRLAWRAVLSLVVAAACHTATARGDDDKPSVRDLVRKYLQKQANAESVKAPDQLPGNIRKVVALEYTVLLRKDDKEEAVDPQKHQFELGDQIRIQVQPLSDLYIYIFHEGASGHQTCLLPDEGEEAPLAKSEQPLRLPDNGYIKFEKPAGDERLIVVATEERVDLKVLSGLVFKKPEEKLSAEELAIQKKLKARQQKTLKSIRDQQTQGARFRGMFDDDVLSKVGGKLKNNDASRAVLEEPPHGKQTSTFSMSVSAHKDGAGELFVSIPLRSATGKR